jgi:hypothetical protein
MPLIPFADNFLAGSLLTLLLPIGLLIAITVWYLIAIRHVPKDTPASSSALPSADVLAAAEPSSPASDDPPQGGPAPAS